jgi:DNA-binding Lrp family transcriptional regulator
LDTTDRLLLDLLQQAFPLTSAPFARLAQRLDLEEREVLERTRRLKEESIIRQIGPIFDSRRLGYHSTLAAFRVDPEKLDNVAVQISAHPGVSHNYSRSHHYNLWFTLTLADDRDLEEEVSRLASECEVDEYLNLPALRVFKIGVRFRLSDARPQPSATPQHFSPTGPTPPTPFERELVRTLQGDLPLTERPFRDAAARLEVTEEHLLEVARELDRRGVMRRFGAVLRHRRAGFTANGMACWVVPEDRVIDAGRGAAAFPQVSHCYQRPAYPPRWPYTLFTMVHGRERDEVEETAERIHQEIGPAEHVILYSQKEYKKKRVQYFEAI